MLSPTPSPAAFASLVASWPYPASPSTHARIAMHLASLPRPTLLYPSPAQYSESHLASLTASLAHLPASSLAAALADPSLLPADLFAALLRLLNLALLPYWVVKLMHVQSSAGVHR